MRVLLVVKSSRLPHVQGGFRPQPINQFCKKWRCFILFSPVSFNWSVYLIVDSVNSSFFFEVDLQLLVHLPAHKKKNVVICILVQFSSNALLKLRQQSVKLSQQAVRLCQQSINAQRVCLWGLYLLCMWFNDIKSTWQPLHSPGYSWDIHGAPDWVAQHWWG